MARSKTVTFPWNVTLDGRNDVEVDIEVSLSAADRSVGYGGGAEVESVRETTSFRAWLRLQSERDDGVGDLARDARADGSWVGHDVAAMRLHLAERAACVGARTALERAAVEHAVVGRNRVADLTDRQREALIEQAYKQAADDDEGRAEDAAEAAYEARMERYEREDDDRG